MSTEAIEVVRAVVDHFANGGEALFPTSPLVALAKDAVQSSALVSLRPALPVRAGLTEAELAQRRTTLGASEIAAVAGVNPYATMHNVWLAKCRGVEVESNEAMELGTLLEPVILAIYANRYGLTLARGQYTLGPEPWMSATPDARRSDGGLCEAKLVGLRSIYQWGAGNTDDQESDEVPLHYLAQAQWQLACTSEPFVDISALLGTEFRSYRIRPNERVQQGLRDRGREFWERYVLTGTPPPVDASEGARAMLKALYPRSAAEPIAATPELEALAEDLRAAREALAAAEAEKRLRENQIKSLLGEASGVFGPGFRIRYATTKAGTRPFVYEGRDERKSA
jgi:putative phage-type endonuclease